MTDTLSETAADKAVASGDLGAAAAILEKLVAEDAANAGLWVKLSAVRNAGGNLSGALEAVDRSLAIAPLDYSTLLYRATLLERLGDPSAGEHFGRALAQMPADDQLPPHMKPAAAHARQRWEHHQRAVEATLTRALPDSLGAGERRRAERFVSNRSRRTRKFHQEPTEFDYPELPEIEFHERSQFAGIDELEAATDTIRNEFEALVAAEAAEMVPYIQYPEHVPLQQWKELNRNPKWTAIHLLRNGERVEANARHCPRTLDTIARLPQPKIAGASPNAMFSLLAPRTRIPPHTGVSNTRLVCHLPLILPAGCGFRCGATTREWRMGEAFIFDDTIEHEAWNDSDELRVVLIVDLWAPALSEGDRRAITAVIEASGATFMGEG